MRTVRIVTGNAQKTYKVRPPRLGQYSAEKPPKKSKKYFVVQPMPARPAAKLTTLTAAEMRWVLYDHVVAAGSVQAYHRQTGISDVTVHELLDGLRIFSPKMAALLGFSRIVLYRRVKP